MVEQIERQMAFIQEMDKMKGVLRRNMMLDGSRHEDDAQHSWHIALMALVLRAYAQPGVDIDHAVQMLLVHDIVEVDAGDTYAYDREGLATQKAREEAAKERVYSLLPDDQKQTLSAIFDEFEADETPEAHFAHTMDNLQPLLLNNSNGGSDWAEHDVNAEQVYGRQRKSRLGSEKLYELTDCILKENIAKGSLKK